jgi:molybdopterin-biosynthesis enzyme MoeA-like protein
MTPNPEFVGADILVSGNEVLSGVNENDGRQLLHFEALGIDLADAVKVHDNFIQVNAGRVYKKIARHGDFV